MPNWPKTYDYYKANSIYGIPISQKEIEEVIPPIPKQMVERWRRLILPHLDRDWNKDHLMQKMVAGYLLDGESIRHYLVASSMSALQRLEQTTEIFRKRVEEEKRALNHEELATLGKLTEATKTWCEAAQTVMAAFCPKRSSKAEKPENESEEPTTPEIPRFYRDQENGEKA